MDNSKPESSRHRAFQIPLANQGKIQHAASSPLTLIPTHPINPKTPKARPREKNPNQHLSSLRSTLSKNHDTLHTTPTRKTRGKSPSVLSSLPLRCGLAVAVRCAVEVAAVRLCSRTHC